MEQKSGKKDHGGGVMEQDFWEAFRKHLRGIWKASGMHVGSICETSGDIWKAFGETQLAGDADRRQTMEVQVVIFKLCLCCKRSPMLLTLPSASKVGVTKYYESWYSEGRCQKVPRR